MKKRGFVDWFCKWFEQIRKLLPNEQQPYKRKWGNASNTMSALEVKEQLTNQNRDDFLSIGVEKEF